MPVPGSLCSPIPFVPWDHPGEDGAERRSWTSLCLVPLTDIDAAWSLITDFSGRASWDSKLGTWVTQGCMYRKIQTRGYHPFPRVFSRFRMTGMGPPSPYPLPLS
jgi:hypothetical protein